MGLGRNFVPCERVDGTIMMKVQVDPMVITFSELVEDIVSHFYGLDDVYQFVKMTKKDVIKAIKVNGEYAAYHGGFNMVEEPQILGGWYSEIDIQSYNTAITMVARKIKELWPIWEDRPINKMLRKEEE